MDLQTVICLYLKGYLTTAGFEDHFYSNMKKFQKGSSDPIYEELLCTDLSDKSQCISLKTFLKGYILSERPALYDRISNAYVERLIEDHDGEIIIY